MSENPSKLSSYVLSTNYSKGSWHQSLRICGKVHVFFQPIESVIPAKSKQNRQRTLKIIFSFLLWISPFLLYLRLKVHQILRISLRNFPIWRCTSAQFLIINIDEESPKEKKGTGDQPKPSFSSFFITTTGTATSKTKNIHQPHLTDTTTWTMVCDKCKYAVNTYVRMFPQWIRSSASSLFTKDTSLQIVTDRLLISCELSFADVRLT